MMSELREKDSDGMYIIDTGRCKLVNPYDNFQISTISRGDFFGEANTLKIPSFNYFGDVIANSESLTCLFISNQDMQRIPIHEIEAMRNFSIKKTQALQNVASKKYGIPVEELNQY